MEINLEKIKQNKTIKELLEFSIINLDKPRGPTSFQAAELAGKMVGAKKFSHFGTLDPLVSGVLPIALNRACRLTTWFMKKDKTYIGIMKIHKDISEEKLKEEMKKFVGKILQKPPVKSRVKREERERQIYRFDILEREGRDVLFKAEVEAGTYIRKLISDLGEKIGGAHMIELRRIKAGIFSENDKEFVTLYELEKAIEDFKQGNEEKLKEILIPGEIVSRIMPVVFVKKEYSKKLYHGSPLMKDFLAEKTEAKEGNVAVFFEDKFIGVYSLSKEKGIFARPDFVLN
ncbi:MAG: RNA-guided pseudouridylation complex pseudouridine synthase subunit Cbf5 [Candidatus Pacearchaeota archaeon]